MTARILFHVQHLLGSGHLRRAAAIAAALAEHGFDVTLLSGGMPVQGIDVGGARLVQLPPTRAADERFRTLLDAEGRPVDDAWRAARRDALLAHFEAFRPDALITELFPLGRRVLRFELVPLLEAARRRAAPPLILSSVRDVLAGGSDDKIADMVTRARSFYDRILVHGDPALLKLSASFPEDRIADRVVYTGYVTSQAAVAPPEDDGRDEIIVSIGGGAVGARLLRAALAARSISAERHRSWRLLVGPNLPAADQDDLSRSTGPGCVIEPARGDFPGLLARCHVSVSQAGYNTVMDVLIARARAVLVPFAAAAETEQTVRAAALAQRGWAAVLEESNLTPERLADAIDRAAAMPRPDPATLRRDGANETARLIGAWLAQRSATA
jgi:predicted glycosyltransferase